MSHSSLSDDARALLGEIEAGGRLPTAESIFRASLPPKRWWVAVSTGARETNAYWAAAKRIGAVLEEDPTLPIWPPALYEIADSLPRISLSEGVAILDRFLHLEANGLTPGAALYQLHWDILAAQYCPLRERYAVLREFVAKGLLAEASGGPSDRDSNLRWPLIVAEALLPIIRAGRLRAKLPILSRIEDFLKTTMEAYPNLVRVLLWMAVGGGIGFVLRTVTDWLG